MEKTLSVQNVNGSLSRSAAVKHERGLATFLIRKSEVSTMAAKEKTKQEESLFVKASTKLSDAQKLTSEAHELVKQDLDSLRRERSAFEEMARILNLVHFDSTIKLNVGGKIYKTTLDTLQKDPDSMLSAMFSGRHELRKDEEDGAYFIDRDGKLFR